mmetsp:Transcript_14295/g.38882  ORF Transcript_14295/g.38882 Transcript_14295/m.38882 type:complete len:229 (-) Transcript_14295:1207-1893(-)
MHGCRQHMLCGEASKLGEPSANLAVIKVCGGSSIGKTLRPLYHFSVVAFQGILAVAHHWVENQRNLRIECHADERKESRGTLRGGAEWIDDPDQPDWHGSIGLGGWNVQSKGGGNGIKHFLRLGERLSSTVRQCLRPNCSDQSVRLEGHGCRRAQPLVQKLHRLRLRFTISGGLNFAHIVLCLHHLQCLHVARREWLTCCLQVDLPAIAHPRSSQTGLECTKERCFLG